MARLIKLYEDNPSEKHLKDIVNVLKNDGLIIYPTDTVYGLGCDINSKKALEKIARIKQIKLEKANLSFVCDSLSNLSDYVAQIDSATFKILKRNLPGPYTFILEGSKEVPKMMLSKRKTAGIRVPDNVICEEIVKTLGNPVLSTTASDKNGNPLKSFAEIYDLYHKLVDIVIDGGEVPNGPSSVISLISDTPAVLREGLGPADEFII